MRKLWIVFATVLALGLAVHPSSLFAQNDEPPQRAVTTLTMDVPYADRDVVFGWMQKWFMPGLLLNPHVLNARILFHWYGSDASQVVLVAEYDDAQNIFAECGKPCDDWRKAHPTPKEGEDGYAAWSKGRDTFDKYFQHHADEIYNSLAIKIEGKNQVTVGGDQNQ